ncbi:MAG: hypothetical protein KatS3mg124_1564 [Porticoccaceae bacterium]|nr:MAG: hypothetical protein KatS3mg124_1564 [Porticoccaceae bacterium]
MSGGAAFALALAIAGAAAAAHGEGICLVQGDRAVVLQVELAADPASRARGLMERTWLAPDGGMLFAFDADQPPSAAFWMYRTPPAAGHRLRRRRWGGARRAHPASLHGRSTLPLSPLSGGRFLPLRPGGGSGLLCPPWTGGGRPPTARRRPLSTPRIPRPLTPPPAPPPQTPCQTAPLGASLAHGTGGVARNHHAGADAGTAARRRPGRPGGRRPRRQPSGEPRRNPLRHRPAPTG